MKQIINILFFIGALLFAIGGIAQNLELEGIVVDENGVHLSGVKVKNNDNVVETDRDGKFFIQGDESDVLAIELPGYQTKLVPASEILSGQIVLLPEVLEEGSFLHVPFRDVERRSFSGAASVVSSSDLIGRLDMNVTSSLKGKSAGLYIREEPGAHSDSQYDILIRGVNSTGNGEPLIIVDGVERPLGYVQSNDVESVTILKDAVAKSFYKGKAANGVILVTTKRGKVGDDVRQISIETGRSMATRLNDPLSSAEYVEYYNLARRNSGLPDLYSESDIQGYSDPSNRYPSNDYYDLLLKDSKEYTRLMANFNGGKENFQYSLSASYVHNGGIEGVGKENQLNQFNIRSNVDFTLTENVDVFFDIYGFLDQNKTNYLQYGDLFQRMSIQRPNEYALILEGQENRDSTSYGAGRYGLSSTYQNLYAEMLEGGLRETTQRIGQTTMGFKFNLNPMLKGLTAKAAVSFDSYNLISVGKNDNFYSYLPVWNSDTLESKTLITVGQKNSDLRHLDSDGYKQFTYTAQFDFQRLFGNHNLNMSLVAFGDRRETLYSIYEDQSFSTSMLANYGIRNKYFIDLNAAILGSSKVSKENQYAFFPAAGLAWVLSEEGFLKDNAWVNFLKLKTSYGITGTDASLDYFAYQTRWNYYDNLLYYNETEVNFGEEGTNGVQIASLASFANISIDWEKSRELNIGVESIIFDRFVVDINYYNIVRSNIPVEYSLFGSNVLGVDNYQINFLSVENNGLEATLGYFNDWGSWRFSANVNANYSKSSYIKATLPNLPGDRALEGKSVDAFIGLESAGLILDNAQLSSINQSFGHVRIGDLSYRDLNNDGYVDQNDAANIGNSVPRLHYGTSISIGYKIVDLTVSGYGAAFYDLFLNSDYYMPQTESAFSELARDSYNPETGRGHYPSLSTENAANNYRLSDFWLASGSYFKLKEIELGIVLPETISSTLRIDKMRFYVKGNNLFTFSSVDDVDPEYINAGYSAYPFMRTFTTGINLIF